MGRKKSQLFVTLLPCLPCLPLSVSPCLRVSASPHLGVPPSPTSYSLRLIYQVGFPPLLFFHEILNLGAVLAQGFVDPDAILAISKNMD